MNMCKIYGHKQPKGYKGDFPYLQIGATFIDGMGQVHAKLNARCDRCNKLYQIAFLHLPKELS